MNVKEQNKALMFLNAAVELLRKQDGSYYVLNLLEETAECCGEEIDGRCLMEEIQEFLFETEEET